MSISATVKAIQDTMREDVGVDGDVQRLGQLVWMLFLKVVDDREAEAETFALMNDEEFISPIPEQFRWRNWAKNDEGMTGDELKKFIDEKLFPTLQELSTTSEDQRAIVIQAVFSDAYNYMKSGGLIRKVINHIEKGFNFNKAKERHAIGDMYEKLLKDLQASKNSGEFYTPRAITAFMAEILDPQLEDSVLDPACGTGGFLTSAIEYKRATYVKNAEDEKILQNSIYGIEKKPLPHLLCTTNMILHGIDIPIKIRHDNTLARPYTSWTPADRVDVILTNPPFGGTEEQGIESNFPSAFRTRETADLFMLLLIKLLKKNGRAAVVLPDGFMFGEGIKSAIKEKLLTDCNLHTIVRLPKSVFAPYTSISTNLLFFTKGEPTKEIWYYEQQLPEGVVAYNKSKPMKLKDLDTLKSWWGTVQDGFAGRVENEQAWKVSITDIQIRNYNLDIKNPHQVEQESHDPEELLANYNDLQKELADIRAQLKVILDDALSQ